MLQLRLERLSGLLQRSAIIGVHPNAASRDGPGDTGSHPQLAQQPADRNRRRTEPTARVEEDRRSATANLGQQPPQAPRSIQVEVPFSRDPFVATGTTEICIPLGEIKDHFVLDGQSRRIGLPVVGLRSRQVAGRYQERHREHRGELSSAVAPIAHQREPLGPGPSRNLTAGESKNFGTGAQSCSSGCSAFARPPVDSLMTRAAPASALAGSSVMAMLGAAVALRRNSKLTVAVRSSVPGGGARTPTRYRLRTSCALVQPGLIGVLVRVPSSLYSRSPAATRTTGAASSFAGVSRR